MTRLYTAVALSMTMFLTLCIPAVAKAAIFVPAGLNPGDTYQLAFTTDGVRNAESSDIADYNSFVRNQAELSALTQGVAGWFAIGSTATVDARDNATVSATVYNLNGDLISTSGVAGPTLYDGYLSRGINFDQFGNTLTGSQGVWTGSTGYGVAEVDTSSNRVLVLGGTDPPYEPGTAVYSRTGLPAYINELWLRDSYTQTFAQRRLYALSEVLTVPGVVAPVPEPTTLAIWSLLGGIGVIVGHRRRRRKAA